MVGLSRVFYVNHVEVLRLKGGGFSKGKPTYNWAPVDSILDDYLDIPGQMMCRIDLDFLKPGSAAPAAIEAGMAIPREGFVFFDVASGTDQLQAGDRINCIGGPLKGTFELRQIPQPAVGFNTVDHMEVQITEVAQILKGIYPAGGATG